MNTALPNMSLGALGGAFAETPGALVEPLVASAGETAFEAVLDDVSERTDVSEVHEEEERRDPEPAAAMVTPPAHLLAAIVNTPPPEVTRNGMQGTTHTEERAAIDVVGRASLARSAPVAPGPKALSTKHEMPEFSSELQPAMAASSSGTPATTSAADFVPSDAGAGAGAVMLDLSGFVAASGVIEIAARPPTVKEPVAARPPTVKEPVGAVRAPAGESPIKRTSTPAKSTTPVFVPNPASVAAFVPSAAGAADFVPSAAGAASAAAFVPSPVGAADFVPSPVSAADFVPSPVSAASAAAFVSSAAGAADFVPSAADAADFAPSAADFGLSGVITVDAGPRAVPVSADALASAIGGAAYGPNLVSERAVAPALPMMPIEATAPAIVTAAPAGAPVLPDAIARMNVKPGVGAGPVRAQRPALEEVTEVEADDAMTETAVLGAAPDPQAPAPIEPPPPMPHAVKVHDAPVKTLTPNEAQPQTAPSDHAEEAVRVAESLGHKRVLASGRASGHLTTEELGRIEVHAHAANAGDMTSPVQVSVHIDDAQARALVERQQAELRAHVQAEVPNANVHLEQRSSGHSSRGDARDRGAERGSDRGSQASTGAQGAGETAVQRQVPVRRGTARYVL